VHRRWDAHIEVDFGDEAVRVEIYSSEETVEIFIEPDFETLPVEHRRFAILNIPRRLFSKATAAVARRAAKSPLRDLGNSAKLTRGRSTIEGSGIALRPAPL
jgi:hypothetical protein